MMKINDLPDSWEIIYPLVERFKSSFQVSKSNWVFEKDVASNILFDYRNWNTLAFRGRLMSLLELRSAGSHRGLWDCDYSPHRKHFLPLESRVFQLLGWVFILNELF